MQNKSALEKVFGQIWSNMAGNRIGNNKHCSRANFVTLNGSAAQLGKGVHFSITSNATLHDDKVAGRIDHLQRVAEKALRPCFLNGGAMSRAPSVQSIMMVEKCPRNLQCCFNKRLRWRCQSRSLSVARLSYSFLPRARPISSLARPRFQYNASGTSV